MKQQTPRAIAITCTVSITALLLVGCEPEMPSNRVLQLEDSKTRASACGCGGSSGKWTSGGRRWGNGGGLGRNWGGGRNWGNGGGGWGGGGNGWGGGGGGGGGWMDFWKGFLNNAGSQPGGQPGSNDYVPPPPQNAPINQAPSQPPTVQVIYPTPLSDVSGGFKVSAKIQHERAVASVEVRVDGNVVGGGATEPYQYDLLLPAGKHILEVRAYDVDGKTGAQSVTFNVVGSNGGSTQSNSVTNPGPTVPTTPSTPSSGLSVFGAVCELDIDCSSGYCVADPGVGNGPRYCSQRCNQGCPVGTVCLSSSKPGVDLCGISTSGTNSSQSYSEPTASGSTGYRRSINAGCSVDASAGAAGTGSILALLLLTWYSRRRNRLSR